MIVEAPNKGGSSPAEGSTPAAQDSEVSATARRRTFTAKYKMRVLREADSCNESCFRLQLSSSGESPGACNDESPI